VLITTVYFLLFLTTKKVLLGIFGGILGIFTLIVLNFILRALFVEIFPGEQLIP